VGLSWSYLIDGEPLTAGALTPNCILVSTPKSSGTVSVEASAGGQSTTLTLNVSAAARSRDSVPMRTVAPAVTTAGDRASL
jgi:hypothetical protein